MKNSIWTAIGLMSGTSMDGVDGAIIKTDGISIHELGPHITLPYKQSVRDKLRQLVSGQGVREPVESEITEHHWQVVKSLLDIAKLEPTDIDIIGFHGHTILHDPKSHITVQIGDGERLAQKAGIDVIYDLRAADVAAGGEGAPLVPVFHRALTLGIEPPIAVLNIGGVANVTWIGDSLDSLMGFDTGPGNALIDDWVFQHTGKEFDEKGTIALKGQACSKMLATLLKHPYFKLSPPKSLDRNAFNSRTEVVLGQTSFEDGVALLTAFTIESIVKCITHLPKTPNQWIITGGGRHNLTILGALKKKLSGLVLSSDSMGWSGDAMEAQAFGYLAVRSRLGLPISFPKTTGIPLPMSGGRFAKHK